MHLLNQCFSNILKILLVFIYLVSFLEAAYTTEKLRVLNDYIDTFVVQCPLTSKPNNQLVTIEDLYWINENLSFNKVDQDVNIPNNLIDKAKLNVKINPSLNYVSCGYLYNNVYTRIKMWNFIYTEVATISLNVRSNPELIYLSKINETLSSISVSPSNNVREWNKPYDLLRFKCVTNYDIPCDTKYVWMYFYNPVSCAYEIWHKNDGNETTENIYQIFINERYQSVTTKSASLSEFLRYLLLNQITSIQFQCASYYQDQYLIATSQNLTIIHGNNFPYNLTTLSPTSSPAGVIQNDNNGVLIGAIIGSILGFLAFLALLLCLIYCCCCYKNRRNRNQNVKITNNQNLAARSTVSMYPAESHDIGRSSYQNLNIHSQHSNNVPIAYLPTSSSTHTVDKITQFNNQIDINNNLAQTTAYSASSASHHNMSNIRSVAPEVYLKMITVTKDVNEDVASIHNNAYKYDQQICTSVQEQRSDYPREVIYSGETYEPEAGFYAERKEYIVHNIHQQQQQQQQQSDISVHYV